ncbi:hypothetical protein SO694_00055146 [Aureococcus anophagefferens]|uniref:Uncharacterized protein n=1 Tax=Aureococcus anophagefferens TaxID=44056 RepID=A0ABR1FXP5_AURAN
MPPRRIRKDDAAAAPPPPPPRRRGRGPDDGARRVRAAYDFLRREAEAVGGSARPFCEAEAEAFLARLAGDPLLRGERGFAAARARLALGRRPAPRVPARAAALARRGDEAWDVLDGRGALLGPAVDGRLPLATRSADELVHPTRFPRGDDMNHEAAYDERKLAAALRDAGFGRCERRRFDPEADVADWTRAAETLYMVAYA